MKLSLKTLSMAALAAAFLAGGLAATAIAQDKMMAVEKREGLMKLNGKNLGMFAKAAKDGDKSTAMEAAKVLVSNSHALGDAALWPAGSGGGESRAKMELWDHMDDFKAKLSHFQQAAMKAEEAAGSGDPTTMTAAFKQVLGACQGCHKAYQLPEKK